MSNFTCTFQVFQCIKNFVFLVNRSRWAVEQHQIQFFHAQTGQAAVSEADNGVFVVAFCCVRVQPSADFGCHEKVVGMGFQDFENGKLAVAVVVDVCRIQKCDAAVVSCIQNFLGFFRAERFPPFGT